MASLVVYVWPPWRSSPTVVASEDPSTNAPQTPQLASRSPECIAAILYLRTLGIDFSVDCTCQPLMSPSGDFPALQDGDTMVGGFPEIVEYLRRNKRQDLNENLTESQRREVSVYMTLAYDKLLPAVMQSSWCDWKNFWSQTRLMTSSDLPFPLSFFVPMAERAKVQKKLSNIGSRYAIQKQAERVLDTLASKLSCGPSGQRYLIGESPTSLDVFISALLYFVRAAEFPNNDLASAIAGRPVLEDYLNLTATALAAPLPKAPPPGNIDPQEACEFFFKDPSVKKAPKSPEEERRERQSRLFLLVSGAIMGLYALFGGSFFRIEVEDDDDDMED